MAGLASAINEMRNDDLSKAKAGSRDVKSQFMDKMNHEFRTPLNAIIGISSLLQLEESLNPEQKDLVDIIRSSGEEMLTMVENILDFSWIESGNAALEARPFDLRDCIKSVQRKFSYAASAKGLNLSCSIDESIPEIVVGDPRRLEQILRNLLENAIKFTEVGEVAIHVSADGSGLIHFSVRDTGIGIPFDSMDRLFKSFSQVDDSLTRRHQGIGLGLATSRRLVELMGGEIWAESQEGRGSTFHFTINSANVCDQCLLSAMVPSISMNEDNVFLLHLRQI